MKSRVFNISIYNRNVPILVEMRGQSASDDVTFLRYGISPHFSHFSHFLAKNGCFWSSNLVQVFSILVIGPYLVK